MVITIVQTTALTIVLTIRSEQTISEQSRPKPTAPSALARLQSPKLQRIIHPHALRPAEHSNDSSSLRVRYGPNAARHLKDANMLTIAGGILLAIFILWLIANIFD